MLQEPMSRPWNTASELDGLDDDALIEAFHAASLDHGEALRVGAEIDAAFLRLTTAEAVMVSRFGADHMARYRSRYPLPPQPEGAGPEAKGAY